jgi:acetyltransferase-like isoleucine patch superfamily enzyme
VIEPEELNLKELMDYYGYRGKFGKFRYYLRFLWSWVLQSIARTSPHSGLTVALQRARGVNIGKHVYIGPRVIIDELYPHLVTVENYVSIGMDCMIFAHSNPTCSLEIKQRFYPRKVAATVIKRGACVYPRCIILAGTTIGENSVIGAGSVVTRDVAPYTVVGGNPAKFIKQLESNVDSNQGNR